jgi:hypothetical protein
VDPLAEEIGAMGAFGLGVAYSVLLSLTALMAVRVVQTAHQELVAGDDRPRSVRLTAAGRAAAVVWFLILVFVPLLGSLPPLAAVALALVVAGLEFAVLVLVAWSWIVRRLERRLHARLTG